MYTLEEFDKGKTKVLKYILFKKRSEYEVRNKFSKTIEENLLNDIIDYLKEAKYIDDEDYLKKLVNNYKLLKNLSLKELKYKLISKGLSKNIIEDYLYENKDDLEEYEIKSATNIAIKKVNTLDKDDVKTFLLKKGYKESSIKEALEKI